MSYRAGNCGRGAVWYSSDEASCLRGLLADASDAVYPSNVPYDIEDEVEAGELEDAA